MRLLGNVRCWPSADLLMSDRQGPFRRRSGPDDLAIGPSFVTLRQLRPVKIPQCSLLIPVSYWPPRSPCSTS